MFERGFKSWCENTAIQIRKDLKLAEVSPLPAKMLASTLAIPVWTPSEVGGLSQQSASTLQVEDWSALTISYGGQDAIVYNPAHSLRRQSTDVMHELSHILMRHNPSQVMFAEKQDIILRTYDKKQEAEADWLAGCLLLPRPALLHIARVNTSTESTLSEYAVSQQLLEYRTNITGVKHQLRRTRT